MRNSLLVKLFLGLAESERQDVLQALRSEVFNRRPEVWRLLEYVEQAATEARPKNRTVSARFTGPPALTKELAFAYAHARERTARKATPAPAYDDAKMRHLMTYATDAIRRYLAWKDWQQEPMSVALYRCRAVKKLGADALFETELARAKEAMHAAPFRSTDYYFGQYALEMEAWEFFRSKQRSSAGNLEAVGEAFGAYVAVNVLRQGCAALAQQALAHKDLPMPYLSETLALVERGAFLGNHAVEVYYCAYRALSERDNDSMFDALKTNIQEHGNLFPDAELRDLYILAINFCIRRLNMGERRYVAEAFDLYRAGLERKVFLENGYLARFTYRNILNVALALNEWEWALEYLHTFAPYLAPAERDNVLRYNLATYYYRLPDHEQALELLRQVEFRDVLYNFDARRMLLRIYYERQEWRALDSLLDSFATYLQRHRETGYHREMYRNLVRFVKRLLALRPDNAPARQSLRAEIAQAEHLAERAWLLEILEQKADAA